jgi:hypothetical protein
MKMNEYKQIAFLILFAAIFSMAADDMSNQYENIPIDDSVSVLQDISANQHISNAQKASNSRVSSANQNVATSTTSSITNVDFSPVQSNPQKNRGAIINVDFGAKGDAEYTAVKTGENSYKVENKSKSIIVAIGAILVSVMAIVLILSVD